MNAILFAAIHSSRCWLPILYVRNWHRWCSQIVRNGDFTVIEIKMKKGEPVERALRRLKKVMDKEGMMKQLRANRYFEKPSEKRRRKSARARSRLLSGR